MVWFKVDDGFRNHPKVMGIPRALRSVVLGLWLQAGNWSAGALTDGAVPRYMLDEFASDAEHAAELVRVGLWEVTDDGWQFHDWQDHQPSREKVLQKREETRQRVADWRAGKKARNAVTPNPVTALVTDVYDVGNAPPDPTRPDPTRKTSVVAYVDQPQSAPDQANRTAAGQLVNGYRAWLKVNRQAEPPRSVQATLTSHVAAMLAEGIPSELLAEALRVWDGKSLGPGVLPSVVHELQRPARRQATSHGGFDAHAAMARAQQREGSQ